ncbi:MAG: Hsp33 family molecular chaperone HslO [Clostridiaceae bacterium]|jgi:molecular chaperone Hsp33|nr:Hsp33 family molecular chaperone HslO [Clostridiaceae bacterium]
MKHTGDHIVRATAHGGQVRAFAARTTETCREMVRLHGLSPVAAAALGRLATGIQIMSMDLKNDDDRISAVVRSDGPIRGMTVTCGPDAMVRGYAWEPVVETLHHPNGKLNVGAAVGKGTLTVIRDTGLGEPQIGNVELVSGEIGEDLAAYYAYSEQTPSAVGLGVRMDAQGILHAGGFLVQMMPEADEALADWMQQRISGFPDVTWHLEEGFDPAQILDLLMGDPDIQYLETKACGYRCDCSRDRMARNLISLGREDLTELAENPDGIELSCHFCGRTYHFARTELVAIAGQGQEEE